MKLESDGSWSFVGGQETNFNNKEAAVHSNCLGKYVNGKVTLLLNPANEDGSFASTTCTVTTSALPAGTVVTAALANGKTVSATVGEDGTVTLQVPQGTKALSLTASCEGYEDKTISVTPNGASVSANFGDLKLESGFYIERDGQKLCFTDLQEAIDAAEDGETVFAVGNPTVDAPVTINDKNITLTGEPGATIVRGDSANGTLIAVESGSLTIENVTVNGRNGKNITGSMLTVAEGAELTIGSGATITGATLNANMNGVAVSVNGGKLTVEDGATFTGNSDSNDGKGLIYAAAVEVVVNGGAFEANQMRRSGGVIAVEVEASLAINGGSFANNIVGAANNEAYGGAVYIGGNANASIMGGTFSSNQIIPAWNNACGGAIGITGGNVTIGGDVVITGNQTLATLPQYTPHGGAIYVGGGNVTINGGTIANNTAGGSGIGNGVYIAPGANVDLAGSGTSGITDSFGIGYDAGSTGGTITVEGPIDHRVNVEFADPEAQAQKGVEYVVSKDNTSDDLKDNFRVNNPGYTFSPVADPAGEENTGALELIPSSAVVAVVKDEDGNYHNFTSVQDAIDFAAANGGTVLLATYTNEGNASLNTSEVVISDTLVIKEGNITFGSINVVATQNDDGTMDYSYETPESPVVLKRGQGFTEEMIRVEEGATLNLGKDASSQNGGIILDGGAVWENGKPNVTDDGEGGAGTAFTGNSGDNGGITAHAPVIVNQGNLNIKDGATIRNNDNNYAAPGEGFGSENYGGGIRNEGAGALNMTGGTIKGCYSREGGAIINVNKPNDKNDGSYSEDSHPVVNISGGTIQNNASQMKGSAIQTIYGGAETNVPGGAVAA